MPFILTTPLSATVTVPAPDIYKETGLQFGITSYPLGTDIVADAVLLPVVFDVITCVNVTATTHGVSTAFITFAIHFLMSNKSNHPLNNTIRIPTETNQCVIYLFVRARRRCGVELQVSVLGCYVTRCHYVARPIYG